MQAVRRIIATVVVCFAVIAASGETAPKSVRYSLPDRKGALELSLGKLGIQQVDLSPDGSKLRLMATGDGGITATIFVQVAEKPGGAAACRDTWWPSANEALMKKAKVKIVDLTQTRQGETEIVRFRVPEAMGQPVNMTDIHGYFAGGDLWAEIHLSETGSATKGQALMDVLGTARMLPEFAPAVMDYFSFGSLSYRSRRYKQAAVYYQKTLDMHDAGENLNPGLWRVLVDQLGMSYGISGDTKQAKAVFERAIAKDPKYPMFYYNLACANAESGDLDSALKNLTSAFEYRANVLPGEHVPDPRGDSSFDRYKKDPRFIELTKKLQLD